MRIAPLLLPLLLCAPAPGQDAPPPPPPLSARVPAGTMLLVEMDDLGAPGTSALARIWAEPEVQHFVRKLGASLEGALGEQGFNPLALVGLRLEDVRGIDLARAGLAVVDAGWGERGPEIDAVAMLESRTGADKVARIAAAVRQALTAFAGVPFEELEVAGRRAWRTRPGGREVLIAEDGARLWLATSAERLAATLAPEGALLAETELFRQAIDRADAARRTFLLYADAQKIGARTLAALEREVGATARAMTEGICHTLGLDAMRAFTVVNVPAGAAWRTEICMTLEERRGMFGLADGEARVAHRFLDAVPRDALYYGAEKIDLVATADKLVAFLGRMDDDFAGEWAELRAAYAEALGFDVRDDLLAALGDDWAAYLAAPPSGGLVPDLVVIGSVKDRAKVEATFAAMADRFAQAAAIHGDAERAPRVVRRTTEFRGATLHYVEITERGGDPVPVAPAWAVLEDRVVVGLWPQAVKHALMAKPSLARRGEFASLVRFVPESAAQVGWVDTKRLAGWAYGSAAPALQVLQGAINREAARAGIEVPFGDLPPAEVVLRHLEGTMFYDARGADHQRYGVVSTLGPGLLVAPAALGVLAALVTRGRAVDEHAERLEDIRRAREEAERRAELARLRAEVAELEQRLAELMRELEEAK